MELSVFEANQHEGICLLCSLHIAPEEAMRVLIEQICCNYVVRLISPINGTSLDLMRTPSVFEAN